MYRWRAQKCVSILQAENLRHKDTQRKDLKTKRKFATMLKRLKHTASEEKIHNSGAIELKANGV